MANETPTLVIGVGGAGISVLNTLDETVRRDDVEEKFEYVAVDSYGGDLRRVPEDASKIDLQNPSDFVDADRKRYPYLTPEMEIHNEGTYRQRPVGRYMIDNIANYEGVSKEISGAIHGFYERFEDDVSEQSHINVLLVNSLAGGTGSGTLPLLSAIISKSIHDLPIADLDTDIYFAGVGMVPEISEDMSSSSVWEYTNTFACLSDISKLLGADSESEFGVPVYSQVYGDGPDYSWALDIPEAPFDSYWLSGRVKKVGTDQGERHRIQDRATAEQILSLSLLEMSPEDWRDTDPSVSKLGTMENSEIYIPHKRVESLCELKEELRDKKKSLTDELNDIEEIQEKKHRLEKLRNDPDSVEEIYENGHEYRKLAHEALEKTLADDEEGFEILDLRISIETDEQEDDMPDIEPLFRERTPEEYAEALETIREGYDLKVQMVAVNELENILTAQDAAPSVREAFDEMVARWWKEFGMEIAGEEYERTIYGPGKRLEYLKQYLTEEIEKIEDSLEERSEEGAIESLLKTSLRDIEYMIPQQILRGEWERLRLYRRVKAALTEAESDVRKIDRILDTVESERNSIKDEIREEVHVLEREIDEIDRKESKIRNRIDELERQISSEEKRLHERNSSESRVELPLNKDVLNEIGADMVAEMGSLKDYVEKGLVEENDLREALNGIMAEGVAWDSSVISRDVSRAEGDTSSRDEIWALSHEDNEEYLSAAYHAMGEQNVGGAEGREHTDAPYSIRIFSYTNRGPVEALEFYQMLEDMAENGRLDKLSGREEQGHKLSFAYPEWYGDYVQEAFGMDADMGLSDPPEPEELTEDE